ncbi:L,D-transpeptidase [Flavobacterium tegetincola]|uniref:L,D-transpeptidase n=1 Tax=Flavobacterium tegetincola TaxID=150172 RepID=UPI0003FE4EA0|nr:L,D-transpeptidase [Flavobacterium tegetincola]
MKKILLKFSAILLVAVTSCKDKTTDGAAKVDKENTKVVLPERVEPKDPTFVMAFTKDWLAANKDDSQKMNLVLAANRTDAKNITTMDSIIIPKDFSGDIAYYMPFPLEVKALQSVDKIIFFSYPSQTFATYEKGALIHTGPTNMGSKKHKTPTGLFFSNWKAEETISTFDDEWKLKWNFNVENLEGVGWHEYSLPGYPASHSCMRLQEKDAKILYDWADQWVLADAETVKVKGTPTVIFGSYDFEAPKPWLKLVEDPKALTITAEELEEVVSPFLTEIKAAQTNRKAQKEVATNK